MSEHFTNGNLTLWQQKGIKGRIHNRAIPVVNHATWMLSLAASLPLSSQEVGVHARGIADSLCSL